MNSIRLISCVLGGASLGLALTAAAVTPADVQKTLAEGKSVTFVDLRSRHAFQAGHIPNAINIPASLVAQKELPALGMVVAYDDGVGADLASAAVAALNTKPGITAVALEGGFAAWESGATTVSTRAVGLSPEEIPYITYDRLKSAEPNDLVIVDLRKSQAPARAALGKTSAPAAMTDLATEFPRAQITRSPFALPARKRVGAAAETPPLLVLIDNGDGSAQEMARALKANGVKRFAVLAGGEEMIVRKGQPGLNRVGSSITVQQSGVTSPTK